MLSSLAHVALWVTGGDDAHTAEDEAAQETPAEALGIDDPSVDDEATGRQVHRLLQQFSVLLEFERLQDLLPSGMYIMPSLESEMTWHGAVFMRQGLYRGGVFKFKLELPEDYPDSAPELVFVTDVFHPMVDPETGRFDVEVVFPEWRPGRDYASFALPHMHRALLRREYLAGTARAPLNAEARRLFQEDPAAFAERAARCAEASARSVHKNPPGCPLQFRPGADEECEAIVDAMKTTDATISPEKRKAAFVDWFCNRYAGQAVRTNVTDSQVETILVDRLSVTVEEPPPKPDGDEDSEDEEEHETEAGAVDDALVAAAAKTSMAKR